VSETVDVSTARPEEHAALGDIVVTAYRSVGATMDDEYAAHVADVAGRAEVPGVVVLAVRVDGRPVGCATVVLEGGEYAEGDFGADVAVLRMFGVDTRWRGRGAGRALVTAAIELARSRGRTGMALYSQPVMRAAHRLYESVGFVRVPEHDWQVASELILLAYALRY
jgi:GNAT superfamily N-acetyltransferase